MADRYWVGGSGNWNSVSTTNWSATSGGAGGASIPTASDNVIIDTNSGTPGTISVYSNIDSACLNFTIAVAGWTVNGTLSSTLAISGSFYTVTGTIFYAPGLTLLFNGSGTNYLTSNGVAMGCKIQVNTLGSLLLGSSFTGSAGNVFTFTVIAGTFSTANFSFTVNGDFISNSGSTRAVYLGSSNVNINGGVLNLSNSAGLTFDDSSCIITCIGLYGGNRTYNYIKINTNNYSITTQITGANTFRILVLSGSGGIYTFAANQVVTESFGIAGNVYMYNRTYIGSDIVGTPRTITCTGGTGARDWTGIAFGSTGPINIDFEDISAGGPAWSGMYLGNVGGNSNISFAAGRNIYVSANNVNATINWTYTSGGSATTLTIGSVGGINLGPLPQDTIVVDDNSGMNQAINWSTFDYITNIVFTKSAAWTITSFSVLASMRVLGNIYISGGLTLPTYTNSSNIVPSLNYSYATGLILAGRNGHSVFIGVAAPGYAINLCDSAYNTITTFSPSVGVTDLIINHYTGTFDVSSGVTCNSFNSISTYSRIMAFGTSGSITAIGSRIASKYYSIDVGDTTNLTITGTPTFYPNFTNDQTTTWGLRYNSAHTLYTNPEDFSAKAIDLNLSSGLYCQVEGHFNNVNITNGTKVGNFYNSSFNGTPLYVHGNYYNDSTSSIVIYGSYNLPINFVTNTSKTITTSGVVVPSTLYFTSTAGDGTWTFNDAFSTSGSGKYIYLNGGTLDLNGLSHTFSLFNSNGTIARSLTSSTATTLNIVGLNDANSYTTLYRFNTASAINLSFSSNVTLRFPIVSGLEQMKIMSGAFTESNAPNMLFPSGGTSTNISFYGGTTPSYGDLNFTGFSGTTTLAESTIIYGSLTIPSAAGVMNGTSFSLTFAATSGTKTISSSGNTLNIGDLIFGRAGTSSATYQLSDSLTCGSSCDVLLYAGTLNLNGFSITCKSISGSNASANARTLAFGTTGSITCIGTGTVVDFTSYTGLSIAGTAPQINLSVATSTARAIVMPVVSEASAISLSVTSGTGTVSLLGSAGTYNNLNFTGFSGAITLAANTKLYGSLTIPTAAGAMTGTSYTLTFSGTSGTKTIASGANTLDINALIFDGGATYRLTEAVVCGLECGTTLTSGTLDLNGFNLRCQTISSSNSNVRTLAFGTTGSITCTGTSGTVVGFNTSTNLTITGTSPLISLSASTASTARAVYMAAGGESGAISLTITAGGTDAITLRGTNGAYKNITIQAFSGSITTANSPYVYGNFTVSSTSNAMTTVASTTPLIFAGTSGTKTISAPSTELDFPIIFDGVGSTWSLSDSMFLGVTRTTMLTNGTLNLNNSNIYTGFFSSSNSNTRTLAFALGVIICKGGAATGATTTVWNTDNQTGMTVTGTPKVRLTPDSSAGTRVVYSGSTSGTEANAISFYATSGTDTITITGSGRKYGTLDFTGFSGTATAFGAMTVYSNLTFSSTMTLNASTSIVTLGSTSGTKTITSAGKTLDFPITFDGVGGTWTLNDALTLGSTRTLKLTNGTFNSNNFDVTTSVFSSSNSNTRSIDFGASQFTITGSGTSWDTEIGYFSLTGSWNNVASINMTSASPKIFAGGSRTWPGLSQGGLGILSITGTNQFGSLSMNVYGSTITLPANTITGVDTFYLDGASGNLGTLNSNIVGTQATLTLSEYTGPSPRTSSYLNIKDINFTPSGYLTVKNSVNQGNNSGIIFPSNGAVLALFLGL